MPVISRTERQVSVGATPQPFSSGDGYAAPGKGLQQIGAAIGKVGQAIDEQEDFDYKMKLSEFTFQESRALDDSIANYQGDGKDFDARWQAGYEERAKAFSGQFSGRTQQRAMLDVSQARNRYAMQAQNARQGFVQQNNIGLLEAHAARVGTTIDGSTESVTRGLQAIDEAVAQVPGLTPRQRHLMRSKAADTMWKAWAQKATPEQMEETLKQFDEGVDKWRQQFDAERKGSIESHGEHSTVTAGSGARFRVASQYAERFAGLIRDLEAEGVEIKADQSGGYAKRNIAGTNTPSRHSHGEAIDINWSENARGARGEMAKRLGPEKLREIAKRHGMTWGGDWRNPDDMHFEIDKKAKVTPASAPAGTMATKADRLALPDRATMGDHAINEFMQIRPVVMKRLEEERAKRAGLEWASGVIEGKVEFNPNDSEGRKFIDQTIGQTDLGKKVFAGDPEAVVQAGLLSERMKYVPKPVYDGLKGLIEHQDPKRQALGWTAIQNLVERNPNILNAHGDDKAIVRQAEYVSRLARLHGMDKAIQIIAAERDPDAKAVKKGTEKDVEKFMKGYEGSNAAAQIVNDMDDSYWPFTDPDIAYDHRQQARAVADYRDLLRRHYEATGDETKAKAYAISEFKQSYGVSTVFGKRVMQYPPERFYPQVKGSHSYITDEVKKLVGTYSPSAKEDSIRLVADRETARGAAMGKPTYLIRVEREDGREEVLPGRFVPDVKGAMGGFKAEFDAEREKARKKRENERLNPPPSAGELMVP
jgi:hypothetical protein